MGDQATALATEPTTNRKFFSRFKLWKGGSHVISDQRTTVACSNDPSVSTSSVIGDKQ